MNRFDCRTPATPLRARAARAALLCAGVWLLAVPAAHAAEADPAAAQPAPFMQYQPWRDETVEDWRQANDRVGEIGGWMTYLREAQQGEGGMAPGAHDHHHHHHGH